MSDFMNFKEDWLDWCSDHFIDPTEATEQDYHNFYGDLRGASDQWEAEKDSPLHPTFAKIVADIKEGNYNAQTKKEAGSEVVALPDNVAADRDGGWSYPQSGGHGA